MLPRLGNIKSISTSIYLNPMYTHKKCCKLTMINYPLIQGESYNTPFSFSVNVYSDNTSGCSISLKLSCVKVIKKRANPYKQAICANSVLLTYIYIHNFTYHLIPYSVRKRQVTYFTCLFQYTFYFYFALAVSLSSVTSRRIVSPSFTWSLKINFALNVSTVFCKNLFNGLAP